MIRREIYMRRIRPFIGSDLIKVMTGIRRCGKSVMLELIRQELAERGIPQESMISMNFEDMRNSRFLSAESLHAEILRRCEAVKGKAYLFFDEIQEVIGWEKCINSLRVSMDCDIYLTGSNATLLSGELATYLAGRYVEFVIYPFSFAEFAELYRTVYPDTSDAECFRRYLTVGGMPYLSNLRFEELPSRQYLNDIYNSVQLKDVIRRYKVRDADLLERIIAYIMTNNGTTFSASSIVKFLKSEHRTVSTETVLNYIRYCCDAFLFYKVRREDVQGRQLLASNEKYYTADHGIREAVFGGNLKNINLILENVVYMELLRRGWNVAVGRIGTKEIDFVCDKSGKRMYIQVAYLLATEETVEREFGAFDEVKDNYPKYVLSMDEFDMSRNGIRHRNLRDFLLEEQE